MHKLNITVGQRGIIVDVLRRYLQALEVLQEGKIPYIKLAYNKLLSNNTPFVDGGEMLCFVEALGYRIGQLEVAGRTLDQQYCLQLALAIDFQRRQYQRYFGPKIEKSS
ncbi:hypothetical protein [Sutcliffiella halmapala]|uniref:hypothetical protein n=1 Tax=Sutcliffiella halmapala TaxID=79882 RepID=UPI000994C4AE|nr:hypothetical protein [Sutcliffiella halmapala]